MIRYGGYPALHVYGTLGLMGFGVKQSAFEHRVVRWRRRMKWHVGGRNRVRVEVVSDLCAEWFASYPHDQCREILRRIADKCRVAFGPIDQRLRPDSPASADLEGGGA